MHEIFPKMLIGSFKNVASMQICHILEIPWFTHLGGHFWLNFPGGELLSTFSICTSLYHQDPPSRYTIIHRHQLYMSGGNPAIKFILFGSSITCKKNYNRTPVPHQNLTTDKGMHQDFNLQKQMLSATRGLTRLYVLEQLEFGQQLNLLLAYWSLIMAQRPYHWHAMTFQHTMTLHEPTWPDLTFADLPWHLLTFTDITWPY